MRLPLYVWILLAMLAGGVCGPFLGSNAAVFGELGKLVIQVIKAAATPLLFLAIVQAILNTEIGGRAGLRLLGFAFTNATIAVSIGLLLSNTLHPGEHLQLGPTQGDLSAYADKKVDFVKTLSSYIPSNFVTPFIENSIISIILIALSLGFALRKVRDEQKLKGETRYRVIEDAIHTLFQATEWILKGVIKLVPLAVFGVVTKTVGEYGFAPLKGLAVYVGVGLLGLGLQVAVTYQLWLVLWLRIPLRRFWAAAWEPVVYAIGTNSSLATLPITLKTLDKLQVSKEASTLGACVGTNLNNDGILLYEGMAVLFVAQASGIHLSLQQQIMAALTSVVAAMGVAGVPEAGFISLALVLNTVGLPIELLPLLLTVDWVIARGRSGVNVLSDLLLSLLIDGRKSQTA